jgi:hypothetical protein
LLKNYIYFIDKLYSFKAYVGLVNFKNLMQFKESGVPYFKRSTIIYICYVIGEKAGPACDILKFQIESNF